MRLNIQNAVSHGQLLRVMPLASEPIVRTIVLEPTIFNLVTNFSEMPHAREADAWAQVYADFRSFIRGDKISLPANPPSNKRSIFAPLTPTNREVWEYRHRPDKPPRIRIFGRIAFRDCFVGTCWRNRGDLPNNDPWEHEKNSVASKWRQIFSSLEGVSREDYPSPPFNQGYYDEYFSEYVLV